MNIEASLREYFAGLEELMAQLPYGELAQLVDLLYQACQRGNLIFTMGNGGHGNTASHMANDLGKHTVVSAEKDRVVHAGNRFKVFCLNDNVSSLTAWANDMGFEHCFSEQLSGWVQPGDVVIGISGSGNSPNILRAFRVAKARGATTVCWSGKEGGKAKEIADLCILVPTSSMLWIEDVHMAFDHAIAEMLRRMLAERNEAVARLAQREGA